ncbi:MAG: transglycosylase SLT domain-containing protein [Deinococcales bacterium]
MSARRRLLLVSLVAACALLLGALRLPGHDAPADARLVGSFSPYASSLLQPYGAYLEAVRTGDALTLQRLAEGSGYLAYRAALELARWQTIDASTRLSYYREALALRIDDPAARDQTRSLDLEVGRTAEQAGANQVALRYYRQALPSQGAVDGLARLEPDPLLRAKDFLAARMYHHALDVLGNARAPKIRAQAEYRLGNYDKALEGYAAWSEDAPNDNDARTGLAWTLYELEDYREAQRIFASAHGESAVYGHALSAEKLGEVDTAVALLKSTGRADDLWKATTFLEAHQRYGDAIPLYMALARGGTGYADDAAYRAYILARRLGMTETAQKARALIPQDSFFAMKLGEHPDVPRPRPAGALGTETSTSSGPAVPDPLQPQGDAVPPAIQLARALVAVHRPDDAVGELLFQLRVLGATTDASSAPVDGNAPQVIAIAQMLQRLGEYRQSTYAARQLITRGNRSLDVWRLAYPTPYAPTVERQAASAGVSPLLVWSVMRKESGFTPAAVSTSDAIGLMQVTRPTWDWLAQLQGDAKPADPFDPLANIRYGAYYLGYLDRYFHGNLELAVPSYNRGQGYIRSLYDGPTVKGDMNDLYRAIDAYQTREYMQSVLTDVAVYKALYPRLAGAQVKAP